MQEITLLPMATRTAGEDGGPQDVAGDVRDIAIYLNVTAVAGTSPTLDVTVEDSPDGTAWASLVTFPQVTTTGVSVQRASRLGRYVRARATIGGTASSFTFEVRAIGR